MNKEKERIWKRKGGGVGYCLYQFNYNKKTFFYKTEEHRKGFEQFYSFTKN